MLPRFIPLAQGQQTTPQRFTPVQREERFQPVARPQQAEQQPAPSSNAPSTLGNALTASRLGSSLLGLGGRLATPGVERPAGSQNTPSLGTSSPLVGGSQVAGGLAGLGSGALNLAQGNTTQGALQLGGGAGQVASGVGTLAPNLNAMLGGGLTVGGQALGAGASLAGIGLGLAQGGTAGERAAVQGAMSLAGNLVPGLGAVNLIGSAVENVVNSILGEGAFGQTPLPFGRGNQFSSADNLASQLSQFRSLQGSNQLLAAIQGTTDPSLLLTMAAMGRTPEDPAYNTLLAPHGELQFSHPQYATPEAFQAAVQAIQQTGDPDLLRQFISGVNIQTGESGATKENYPLTDWYRRQLVSLLPETHPLRQDMAGLFAPTPPEYLPEQRAASYLQTINSLNQQYGPSGGPQYSQADAVRGLLAGNVGSGTLATMFRPASELMTPERAAQLAQGVVPWVNQQVYPQL